MQRTLKLFQFTILFMNIILFYYFELFFVVVVVVNLKYHFEIMLCANGIVKHTVSLFFIRLFNSLNVVFDIKSCDQDVFFILFYFAKETKSNYKNSQTNFFSVLFYFILFYRIISLAQTLENEKNKKIK